MVVRLGALNHARPYPPIPGSAPGRPWIIFAHTPDMLLQKDEPPRHRVYMYLEFQGHWYCQFLEEDLNISLPRVIRFVSADKVVQNRATGWRVVESGKPVGARPAIVTEQSGVFLSLTEDQYAKLRIR